MDLERLAKVIAKNSEGLPFWEGSTCAVENRDGIVGWNMYMQMRNVTLGPDTKVKENFIDVYELSGDGIYGKKGIYANLYVSLDVRKKVLYYEIPVIIDKMEVHCHSVAIIERCIGKDNVFNEKLFLKLIQEQLDRSYSFELSPAFVPVDDIILKNSITYVKDSQMYTMTGDTIDTFVDFDVADARLTDYLISDYKGENVEFDFEIVNKENGVKVSGLDESGLLTFLDTMKGNVLEIKENRYFVDIKGERNYNRSMDVVSDYTWGCNERKTLKVSGDERGTGEKVQ